MQAVKTIVHPSANHVTIEIPQTFVGQDIEVIAFPAAKQAANSYDFSDLAGNLAWSGAVIKTQQDLRDEW
jgi:hypothetical protein